MTPSELAHCDPPRQPDFQMNTIYEDDKLLAEYLLFHYGTPDEILNTPDRLPNGMREALDFPCRTVRRFTPGHAARALDLGCAVGRSTFELARCCDEVTGIDFSKSFINAAQSLQRGESLSYKRLDEAKLRTPLTARAPADIDTTRVRFQHGDATQLPDDLGGFNRIHAANLLCRLRDPMLLLKRLPALLIPGGELVLATPCTWLDEFTPRQHWPTGRTLDWLIETLTPDFNLIKVTEEPFLIRETERKFQWTTSQTSLWLRKG
jgi:putative 4-mercaptohistidine N1-methyltranferase